MARNLEAQLQVELIKEERLARKKEEEANIALIESWENTQAIDGRSSKRAGDKLESNQSKKQKTDENEEVEVDNEAELKKHMVAVKDGDIAINAIPLATKPLVIVEYKLIKEGIMGHYQLIGADGSFKIYSSIIRMLQGIDREELQTLWKLVKTKHGDTRPGDEHERVLWEWFPKKSALAKRRTTWFDLFLKSDIAKDENHILGPSTVTIAKKFKELIQKDELTIADFEGVGLERLKVKYNNDVELENHVS
ncbi:hypothetical protein Tco_1132784 [Tanacetum coccineum]|uniref:Uncharacterized protein n=1 Tax=Tanacetum coccineum TaxID=301880 RepID=A0ABQ5JD19_9ASTR